MWPNPRETEDMVTFNEVILIGKLHFLYSDRAMDTLVRKLVLAIYLRYLLVNNI